MSEFNVQPSWVQERDGRKSCAREDAEGLEESAAELSYSSGQNSLSGLPEVVEAGYACC